MELRGLLVLFCVLCSVQFIGIHAYPTLFNAQLLGFVAKDKHKRGDLGFPQADGDDADVIALEHLKRVNDDANKDVHLQHHQLPPLKQGKINADTIESDGPVSHSESLPELERQLQEAAAPAVVPTTPAAPKSVKITEASESQEVAQEELEHFKAPKVAAEANPPVTPEEEAANGGPVSPKTYHGAARLAFGQRPEVLPTSSTSSTSTTTVVTTTSSASHSESSEPIAPLSHDEVKIADDAEALPPAGGDIQEPAQAAEDNEQQSPHPMRPHNPPHEIIGDVVVSSPDAPKAAERRSSNTKRMSPKTAKKLLDPRDGGYSPFDMAQYIFWTGDEAGVARTVEELIEKGVITREDALKFLRDIRMGVEYLQRTYESHILPEITRNHIKKSYPPLKTSTTTTSTTTTTTEKPFRPLLQQSVVHPNSHLSQGFNGFAMLNELQKLNSNDKQEQAELSDYDDNATGRAKIAEFLYTEYTLEEILYKLAKVMFTQSLADGSDKAKQELQKLTNFLEREGNLGVIPINLQKKVLHVLLTALSDTLNEHPELLPAARLNLAESYNWFPERNYAGLLN